MSDKELIIEVAKDILVKLLDHPGNLGMQKPKDATKLFGDLVDGIAPIIKNLNP